MAFGVDGKVADVEAGPADAANERGDFAAELGREEAVFQFEAEAVNLHPQHAGFFERKQPIRYRGRRDLHRRQRQRNGSVKVDTQLNFDRLVEEGQ